MDANWIPGVSCRLWIARSAGVRTSVETFMDTRIIAEVARATLAGEISFPEVVRKLSETGVEYYHVDYVALAKTFYSGAGEVATAPISYEGLPPVAAEFD